jgi:hypothetical protein
VNPIRCGGTPSCRARTLLRSCAAEGRVPSQVPSLRRMWRCGCCRHAARGVVGAAIRLCSAVVALAMPRAASRSLLLCRVALRPQS